VILLLDQGMPLRAAAILRERGVPSFHAAECGLRDASDEEIIAYAAAQQSVIVTLDADFHALLALARATEPSVIRLRQQRLRAAAAAEVIEMVLNRCASSLEAGAAVTVHGSRIAIRLLPIVR